MVGRLPCWLLPLLLQLSSASASQLSVRGVQVQRMPLFHNDQKSPHCFVASSIMDLPSKSNFLATQVWPSARVAALALQQHANPAWTVCEFGCGPGLPSLTAASLGCSVIATDLDEFALDLVQMAAEEQTLNVKTRKFDLIQDATNAVDSFDDTIDLVVFSDVFENEAVANGAALVTQHFLERGSRVWTFAQTDRAQREAYAEALSRCQSITKNKWIHGSENLTFSTKPYDPSNQLWLCDLDETKVTYG